MKRFIVGLVLWGLIFSVVGCGKSDVPSFAETTNESVLLRYNFTKGQETLGTLDMGMKIEMNMMGNDFKIPVNMLIQFNNRIKDVDAQGVASVELALTRIKMSMKMLGIEIDFDSDKSNKSGSEYEAFRTLLNKKIAMNVDPRGEIVNFDFNTILSGFKGEVASQALASMKQTLSELKNSLFVVFPKEPVKAGDIFNSRVIEQDLPSVGKMSTKMKYKVLSVSKDKKKILLKPLAKFSLKSGKASAFGMSIDSVGLDGWILFNLENNSVEKSNIKTAFVFSMKQGDKKIDMKMTVDIKYKDEIK